MDKRDFMLSEDEMLEIENSALSIEKEETVEAAGAAWASIPALVGAFAGIPTVSG